MVIVSWWSLLSVLIQRNVSCVWFERQLKVTQIYGAGWCYPLKIQSRLQVNVQNIDSCYTIAATTILIIIIILSQILLCWSIILAINHYDIIVNGKYLNINGIKKLYMYSKNYIIVFAAGIRCKTCLLLFIFIKSKLSENLQGLITTSLFSKIFKISNSFFHKNVWIQRVWFGLHFLYGLPPLPSEIFSVVVV